MKLLIMQFNVLPYGFINTLCDHYILYCLSCEQHCDHIRYGCGTQNVYTFIISKIVADKCWM
jgi:hypothetical protein